MEILLADMQYYCSAKMGENLQTTHNKAKSVCWYKLKKKKKKKKDKISFTLI